MFELPTTTAWQALTLTDTWCGRMRAHSNDSCYHITVRMPTVEPPPHGLPVLYLLDAGDLFLSVAETLRRTARRPESTGIGPAVLVGIDHDVPRRQRNAARRRDYTPGPCATEQVDGAVGGAAALLDFITEQLAPMIERDAPIDPARRGLVGHSLAGYFCLWALAARPQACAHYAAISPSIWWDPAALHEPLTAPASLAAVDKVYVAAGEWESEPAPWQHQLATDAHALARRRRRDMIGHARALSKALAPHLPANAVRFDLLPGEDHASVVGPAVTRALRHMQVS